MFVEEGGVLPGIAKEIGVWMEVGVQQRGNRAEGLRGQNALLVGAVGCGGARVGGEAIFPVRAEVAAIGWNGTFKLLFDGCEGVVESGEFEARVVVLLRPVCGKGDLPTVKWGVLQLAAEEDDGVCAIVFARVCLEKYGQGVVYGFDGGWRAKHRCKLQVGAGVPHEHAAAVGAFPVEG